MDANNKLEPEFEQYALRTLMWKCVDFKEELSAMEVLLLKLSEKGYHQVKLLISPKYHCELAGDGVEYVWGLVKKYY